MPLQRKTNPLPRGLYWQDIFAKDEAAFNKWLANAQLFKAVQVVRSEHTESDPPRTWVLFRVLDPIRWDGPGFPTIAEREDLTAADTGQKPDVPPGPNLEDVLPKAASPIAWLVGGLVAYKALDLVAGLFRRK